MGIREKLNDNPAITTGITAAIIVIALIFIGVQLFSSNRPPIPTKAWYTADDGETYKAFERDLIPPFEREGKTWVGAVVFRCKKGKPFVSYVQRYTPKAKAALEAANETMDKGEIPSPDIDQIREMGLEIKKPGAPESDWVSQMNYEKAAAITRVQCPDGTIEGIEPVVP